MKLSTRPHRGVTRPRIIAAFAAASCTVAILAAAGPATAGTAAARTGATAATASAATASAATASPTAANGRIAFSQWDLLPGGKPAPDALDLAIP